MKLQFENTANTITAYGPGWIRVGDQRIDQPCFIHAGGATMNTLPPTPQLITEKHIEMFSTLDIEIILLGTGARQIFIDQSLLAPLAARGIGLEVMDTGAACRSFNILLTEGRAVGAALYML